jgi:hypothetical protein
MRWSFFFGNNSECKSYISPNQTNIFDPDYEVGIWNVKKTLDVGQGFFYYNFFTLDHRGFHNQSHYQE